MKKAKFVTSLILAGTMAVLLAAAPVLAQPARSDPMFDRDIREIERIIFVLVDLRYDGDVLTGSYHYDDDGNVDGVIVLYRDLSEAPPTYALKQADENGNGESTFGILDQCRVRLIEEQSAARSPAGTSRVDSFATALFVRYGLAQPD
jgi:hypothetical protein